MSKVYSVTIENDKRKKRDRKKTKKKITLSLVFIFLVLLIGGYFIYSHITQCVGDECNPILKPIVATIEPKLKQDDYLTNMLVVGIDTRSENSGLMNTDTIIIVTINHKDENIIMTSIPRDLWVKYTLPNGNTASSKINSAYANGEYQEEGKGIETLQGAVEDIVGVPIHYYVKVSLQGFIDIVDTIGGVDVYIPEYYKDAYPASELPFELQATCIPFYHDGKYCLFEFKKGTEHMDGQRALIYARCRLLSPQGDFDRAQRQQEVINSVKIKILSSDTLLDPQKLWEMYNVIKDNIESSPFTINDIRAVLNLKDEIDTDKVGNVVLDPYFGNVPAKYIYRPNANPERGYYIIAYDQTYEVIHEMLSYIMEYPILYNEVPVISIYNATGNYNLTRDWAAELKEDNPLIVINQDNRVIQNLNDQYTGISIYKFTEEDKTKTEEYLKNFFEVDEIITDTADGTKAYAGEDYVIVIGIEEGIKE